jgi:hypothetical protein
MTKALFNSTWMRCWKIIRIIPFLADSGAFVTGVWTLLHHFQMSWGIGIAVVVLGLVGIGAFVSRLERSKSYVQPPSPSESNNITPQFSWQVSEVLNRGQRRAKVPANSEISPTPLDHSLKLKVDGEKCELKVSLKQWSLEITIGGCDQEGSS